MIILCIEDSTSFRNLTTNAAPRYLYYRCPLLAQSGHVQGTRLLRAGLFTTLL